MSECVVRMKVPMRCSDCDAGQRTKSGIRCPIASRQVGFSCVTGAGNVGLPHYCPIVHALPENHGRLVDADAYDYPGDLKWEPTIVPAERKDNGKTC